MFEAAESAVHTVLVQGGEETEAARLEQGLSDGVRHAGLPAALRV